MVFVQGTQSDFNIPLSRGRSAFCDGKSHHMLSSRADEAEWGESADIPDALMPCREPGQPGSGAADGFGNWLLGEQGWEGS